MSNFRTLVVALALALAGCALAPEYRKPEAAIPTAYKEALTPAEAGSWKLAEPSDAIARGEWWTIFGDARLNALQAEATNANQTLKAGFARLQQARAIARITDADRYPQVNAGFGPTRTRPSPASQGLAADADTRAQTLWRAQATASYEVDLFGRLANAVQAAEADADEAEALYRSLLLAIHADVAQHYFALRALDQEIALLNDTVKLREEALSLTASRYRAGETSELDQARAQTELSVTRADAAAAARRRAELEHALAVLVGKAPVELTLGPAPFTFEPIAIPAGLPSALLERRPDVAAAERALAAANARIGVAKAAFVPSLTLTGAAGFESEQIGDLFRWSSRTWLLGPLFGTLLSMPILDGGRNRANEARAYAQYDEAVADYRNRVLVAFQEVEDNLAGLRFLSQQARERGDSIVSSKRAAEISESRYRNGYVNYLEVIDAQRSVLAAQRAATQISGERALATVALIRALGGGWGAG